MTEQHKERFDILFTFQESCINHIPVWTRTSKVLHKSYSVWLKKLQGLLTWHSIYILKVLHKSSCKHTTPDPQTTQTGVWYFIFITHVLHKSYPRQIHACYRYQNRKQDTWGGIPWTIRHEVEVTQSNMADGTGIGASGLMMHVVSPPYYFLTLHKRPIVDLWYFLWLQPEQAVEQTLEFSGPWCSLEC